MGRAVLGELVAKGYEVIALVRANLPDIKGYRPIFGNLTKIHDIGAEIARTDGIIHCASSRTADRSIVLHEDVEATGRLLDVWTSGPFVYMSSQTVYGVPSTVLREDSSLNPCTWYDLGKVYNEFQVGMESERDTRGVGISLRLPVLFSSGPRRRDRQFLPNIYDALRTRRPFLFADAEAVENCGSVYIGEMDLGRAVVDSLSIQNAGQYNVAGGFCTWKELLETIARFVGVRPEIKLRMGAVPQGNEFRVPQSRSFYDCSRFVEATGFRPQQSLDDIIQSFVHSERNI